MSHGCTGKGNDQVRFELAYKALAPQLTVIAPWRMWNIRSREDAIDYAAAPRHPPGEHLEEEHLLARHATLWHMSHEGGDLEDPWNRPQEPLFQLTQSPRMPPTPRPRSPIGFEKGFPVSVNGRAMKPFALLVALNRLGAANGIGRSDIVENRRVGMKSRGVYETPGGTILFAALRELDMITLDADCLHISGRFRDLRRPGVRRASGSPRFAKRWRPSSRRSGVHHGRGPPGAVQGQRHRGRRAPRRTPCTRRTSPPSGPAPTITRMPPGFINLYGLATGVAAIVRRGVKKETGQVPKSRRWLAFTRSSFMKKHPLLWFFLLTFGITWGLAVVLFAFPDFVRRVTGPMSSTNPLFILAVWGPTWRP